MSNLCVHLNRDKDLIGHKTSIEKLVIGILNETVVFDFRIKFAFILKNFSFLIIDFWD